MRCALILATVFLAGASSALAEPPQPSHGYDKLDASFEAEQFFDGRRQFLVERQRRLNDETVFWSRSFPNWAYFEAPWPFLPGDIHRYPLPMTPIERPTGRVGMQVGPNTWYSRPIYGYERMPVPRGAAPAGPGPRAF